MVAATAVVACAKHETDSGLTKHPAKCVAGVSQTPGHVENVLALYWLPFPDPLGKLLLMLGEPTTHPRCGVPYPRYTLNRIYTYALIFQRQQRIGQCEE